MEKILYTRILIAGGSGFIGKNLNCFLKHEGFIVSNLSLRKNNWNESLAKNWDVVINLIGKAHDHKGITAEEEYVKVNLDYTKLLFTEFLNSKAKLFIHISSIAAIEEFQSNKALEEIDECNPSSFYGKSKLMAEEWLLNQKFSDNKKLIILRPPMVHGKGDKGNLGLLYKFISKGIPYPLSAYDNKRSFISIENFNFFILQIIKKPGFLKSKLYHISDNEPLSTKDIIQTISAITKKKQYNIKFPKFLVFLISKIGDVVPLPINSNRLKKLTGNLEVSNKKIRNELGIDNLPNTAIEGIRNTIKSF